MDDADLAQENQEIYRTQALRVHFEKRNPPVSPFAKGEENDEPLWNEEGKRICRDCETRIPQKRLKAIPDALRCIECQIKHERGERLGVS